MKWVGEEYRITPEADKLSNKEYRITRCLERVLLAKFVIQYSRFDIRYSRILLYSAYISIGGQVHTKFRSPAALFTRPTEAQNL